MNGLVESALRGMPGLNMAYLGESVPPPPKVGVGDDADGFAELRLDVGRASNHQAHKAFLNRLHLCLGDFIVSFFVLR